MRVHLCGRFAVRRDNERFEERLPGRQGRQLFAFLSLQRRRPIPREELIEVLWPEMPPIAAANALRALLSKLRHCDGGWMIEGRDAVQLVLPPSTWIDVEAAEAAVHRAETAVSRGAWVAAYGPAHAALHITERRFLIGHEAPWIDRMRSELDDVHVRALECTARTLLGLGPSELATAERLARRLVHVAPFREGGHRLLMEILAARDATPEALRVYDALRRLLREELGVVPGPRTQALHERLLAPTRSVLAQHVDMPERGVARTVQPRPGLDELAQVGDRSG
jgi:DNA-binding SARP family transcriptional activator